MGLGRLCIIGIERDGVEVLILNDGYWRDFSWLLES